MCGLCVICDLCVWCESVYILGATFPPLHVQYFHEWWQNTAISVGRAREEEEGVVRATQLLNKGTHVYTHMHTHTHTHINTCATLLMAFLISQTSWSSKDVARPLQSCAEGQGEQKEGFVGFCKHVEKEMPSVLA